MPNKVGVVEDFLQPADGVPLSGVRGEGGAWYLAGGPFSPLVKLGVGPRLFALLDKERHSHSFGPRLLL